MRFRLTALAAACVLAASAFTPVAHARSGPVNIKIVPHSLSIGKKVKVYGSHFPAEQYVTLLLAVPNNKSPRSRAFLALLKVGPKGSMIAIVKVPIVTACGHARVYAYVSHKPVVAETGVMVHGCKASRKHIAPPPPPSPPKKKKP